MSRAIPITLAALMITIASGISALASGLILTGDAMPTSVQADGRSFTRIAISATGADGEPAPDGTEVRFTTTAGSMPTAAYTSGGRATAILVSPTTPQVAMVTATALGSSTSIQVEFSSAGGDARQSARVIRLKGGSLAYAIDRDIVLASENITLEYEGMTITAASAQISETLGTIRAQGSVHIRRSSKTFDADAFSCDLRSGRCRVLTNGTTSMVHALSPERLQTSADEPTSAMNSMEFSPLDAIGTKTWIISKRLTVFPREKIQFFKASIYVGEARVLNVPYYSFSYENRESILQQIRYSSQDGLIVNFPLYYHMADSGMGAFKLQYSGSGNSCGIFAPNKGMSLGLEQRFSTGGQSDGKFSIDSLCDSQRSFRLSNHLDYGGMSSSGRVDISTQYQPTSTYAKGVYTTFLNANGGFGKIDYSICGYMGGSRVPVWSPANGPTEYAEQSSGSITSSFRPRQPFSIGRGVTMIPNLLIGYGRPGAWYGGACGEQLYQSLGLNFSFHPLISNRNWNLTLNSSSALTTTMHGDTGTGFRTGADLRRSWQGGSASLSYTLNLHTGNVGTTYSQSVHNLGASLFVGSGARWSCNAYAGYGIDTGTMNLYSSASCQLAKAWRIRTSYTFYRYMCSFNGSSLTSDTSYLKAGIYHPIGPYEVGVAWSPEGQQYGLKGGKRVWLEIGSSGF